MDMEKNVLINHTTGKEYALKALGDVSACLVSGLLSPRPALAVMLLQLVRVACTSLAAGDCIASPSGAQLCIVLPRSGAA